MSYKSRWFDKEIVEEVAEHFDVDAGFLLEKGGGAYGGNMENKLRNHPEHTHDSIRGYLGSMADRDRRLNPLEAI